MIVLWSIRQAENENSNLQSTNTTAMPPIKLLEAHAPKFTPMEPPVNNLFCAV